VRSRTSHEKVASIRRKEQHIPRGIDDRGIVKKEALSEDWWSEVEEGSEGEGVVVVAGEGSGALTTGREG
jgi:hypothetical protein